MTKFKNPWFGPGGGYEKLRLGESEGYRSEESRRNAMSSSERDVEDEAADAIWNLQHPRIQETKSKVLRNDAIEMLTGKYSAQVDSQEYMLTQKGQHAARMQDDIFMQLSNDQRDILVYIDGIGSTNTLEVGMDLKMPNIESEMSRLHRMELVEKI